MRAIQPCELPGFVNEKQVTCIEKKFPNKLRCRKLKLDFVVAGYVEKNSCIRLNAAYGAQRSLRDHLFGTIPASRSQTTHFVCAR